MSTFEYPSVALLGSTGSIGRQTLELAATKNIKITAIAANRSAAEVERQARRFTPRVCAMADEEAAKDLRVRLADTGIGVLSGEDGICEAATADYSDCVLDAVIGAAGLKPALAAADAGKKIALANKESLVMAGDLLVARAAAGKAEIRPVDSEHSAIWQCLTAGRKNEVSRLIITASGGPFFGKKREELENKTVADALAHPTWSMGARITIDSATLMNKGFEVIEAAKLFGFTADKIDVLVHRESIIHSMVEYIDNSVIAQLSVPDMRICINRAISYPDRCEGVSERLDLASVGKLTFAEPDTEAFPLLALAFDVLRRGGALAAVMNAANEVSVDAFLEGKIRFGAISDIVCETVGRFSDYSEKTTLEEIFDADKAARAVAAELCRRR